jgi:hypothetical protein
MGVPSGAFSDSPLRTEFAMAASIGVHGDYSASDLRSLARRCGDAEQVRRLLAIALILDGGGRAAKIGGVTRCKSCGIG